MTSANPTKAAQIAIFPSRFALSGKDFWEYLYGMTVPKYIKRAWAAIVWFFTTPLNNPCEHEPGDKMCPDCEWAWAMKG